MRPRMSTAFCTRSLGNRAEARRMRGPNGARAGQPNRGGFAMRPRAHRNPRYLWPGFKLPISVSRVAVIPADDPLQPRCERHRVTESGIRQYPNPTPVARLPPSGRGAAARRMSKAHIALMRILRSKDTASLSF